MVTVIEGPLVERTCTVWKKVPSSPAGCKPKRFASLAMYSTPLKLPIVPGRRPCIESSAKMKSRVRRSAAVIAAVVGVGL